MKKLAALALTGLVALASGNQIEITRGDIIHKIGDLQMNIDAIQQGLVNENSVESLLSITKKHMLGATASKVDWSTDTSCPNKADIVDPEAIPDPPIVGKSVGLSLTAVWNQEVDVQGLYVDVLFTAKGATSPVTLFKQDYKAKNQ